MRLSLVMCGHSKDISRLEHYNLFLLGDCYPKQNAHAMLNIKSSLSAFHIHLEYIH